MPGLYYNYSLSRDRYIYGISRITPTHTTAQLINATMPGGQRFDILVLILLIQVESKTLVKIYFWQKDGFPVPLPELGSPYPLIPVFWIKGCVFWRFWILLSIDTSRRNSSVRLKMQLISLDTCRTKGTYRANTIIPGLWIRLWNVANEYFGQNTILSWGK